MTEEDEQNFKNAEICWLCEQSFFIESESFPLYNKRKIE